MSERDDDPIASTQMFRAFAHRDEARPAGPLRPPAIMLSVMLAVAIVALVTWLIVR